METIKKSVLLFWKESYIEWFEFWRDDITDWKSLFENWKNLKKWLKRISSREPNLPEWISEVAFCIVTWSIRVTKVSWPNDSFDTFNLKYNRAEQIKACSVERDLTSFWPKSKRDDLYFLDFFNEWKLDWTFDIYKINDYYIENFMVNKNQTFTDQQKQQRRPRLSIKKIIKDNSIKPIYREIKL